MNLFAFPFHMFRRSDDFEILEQSIDLEGGKISIITP
jgi:hypothetical protein